MLSNTNSSAYVGDNRPNPYETPTQTQNPTEQRRLHDTVSLDFLQDWLPALKGLPPSTLEWVEGFLAFVALGVEFPYEDGMEQAVYNELIQAEAYDVFVEVFRAFNQIAWPSTREEDRPDPYRLTLQLPHDWIPALPLLMIDAFEEVPVQTLVLLPQEPEDDAYFWLPDAAHDCLLALLTADNPSLTELVINGVMEEPACVAEALKTSALQTIELGWSGSEPPDEDDVEHYASLVRGLAGCSTLTHIQIAHPAFLSMHAVIDEGPSHGLKLSSVGIEMDYAIDVTDTDKQDHVEEFMWTLHELSTVTTVTAHASVANGESLNAVFIEPLSHHKTLERLEILGNGQLPTDPWSLNALTLVASLSTSCPTLKHFVWTEDEQPLEAGDNLRAFKRAGGDLDMLVSSAILANAMAPSTFLLQSLTFNGQAFPSGILRTFFTQLLHNKTLSYLNLLRCHSDLRSVLVVLEVLKNNTTLKTILLSRHYDDYYFVASDENVYGFQQNLQEAGYDTDTEDPTGFNLVFGEGVTAAERALALTEFAELQAEADQLFAILDAHNLRSEQERADATARAVAARSPRAD